MALGTSRFTVKRLMDQAAKRAVKQRMKISQFEKLALDTIVYFYLKKYRFITKIAELEGVPNSTMSNRIALIVKEIKNGKEESHEEKGKEAIKKRKKVRKSINQDVNWTL